MDKADISQYLVNAYKNERLLKIEKPPVTERRQYDEKLVAWIDILGMRAKIHDYKNHDAEDILTIMSRFQNYVRNSCENIEELVKYIQISDGIIIVSEFDYLKEICEILCQIQWKILINDNMILRGALTSGKIRINEDPPLIIGPAFVEAFELESENAIFPRIIISHELCQLSGFKFINEDSDHFYFLDFLEYVVETENLNNKQLLHYLRTSKVIKYLKTEYNAHIGKDNRTAQKYGWLISKLSDRKIKVL